MPDAPKTPDSTAPPNAQRAETAKEKRTRLFEVKKVEKPETKEQVTPEKKAEPKAEKKPAASPGPLTTANWTPDIVAAGLGIGIASVIAPLLALSTSFLPGTGFLVFAGITVFLTAWVFGWLCGHMELTGFRRFQQAHLLVLGTAVGVFAFSLIMYIIGEKMRTMLEVFQSFPPEAGISAPAPLSLMASIPRTTPQSILLQTLLLMVLMLIPASIQGRKDLKAWWYLPIIVPIALCLLLYWVLGNATLV